MIGWPSAHGLVDAHFAGTTSAAGERRLWRHLPGCERCRDRYRRHALLEALEGDEMERARRRLGRGLFASRFLRAPMFVGVALAAACLALVFVPRTEDPRPRGGLVAGDGTPRLAVFRVAPGQAPVRAGGVIQAGDALAFSYVGVSPELRYLMVFAVDASGRVYWFWPAWQEPSADPQAIAVAASAAPVELGEAVRHPFPPGRLTIHALFTRQPRRVREVEALAGRPEALAAIADRLWTETLEVTP